MFHGYRRFVSLALSVCCILSMLFLDTLGAKAQVSVTSINSSGSLDFYYDMGDSKYSVTSGHISSGSIRDGTGSTSSGSVSTSSISNNNGDYEHFKIPLNIHGDINGSPSTTDYIAYVLYLSAFSLNVDNNGQVYNVCLTDSNGKLICVGVGGSGGLITNFGQVSDIWSTQGQATVNYYLEFDVNFKSGVSNYRHLSGSFTTVLYLQPSSESEVPTIKVSDVQASQHLSDIKTNAEQTNQNTANIFSKISDFFASFFQNIRDSLISVFVPEDGYFSSWFQRLNDLLAQKLGMLYAPFDLIISTLTAIMNADSSETGIPFPGIKWEDTWLVEPFTFTFSSLGDDMSNLRENVYFATDVVLLFAFLYLLEEKIRHILED